MLCTLPFSISLTTLLAYSDYRIWARELRTTPQCAGESDIQRNKAIDLALYMLIWGEAANLRHMPEWCALTSRDTSTALYISSIPISTHHQ